MENLRLPLSLGKWGALVFMEPLPSLPSPWPLSSGLWEGVVGVTAEARATNLQRLRDVPDVMDFKFQKSPGTSR